MNEFIQQLEKVKELVEQTKEAIKSLQDVLNNSTEMNADQIVESLSQKLR